LQRYVHAARAICAYLLGRPLQVLVPAREAERLYHEDTRGDEQAEYYHLFTVLTVRIAALAALGDYPLFLSELDGCLEKARATDNQSMLLHLTLHQALSEQLRGQSALSRPRLEQEWLRLPKRRFSVLHVLHMCAVMSAAIGGADGAWARPVVDPMWAKYQRSAVHRSAYLALIAHQLHAHMLLNQAVAEASPERAASRVAADVQIIERCPLQGVGLAMAACIRARVCILEQQPEAAVTLLRDAADKLEAADHRPAAAQARFVLGRVLANGEGRALCAAVEQQLLEQGVSAPQRYLESLYPELRNTAAVANDQVA
jgi:hypothetical protein